ncbi:hypothetical protein G6F37_005767 [Rhizopus arrhizus]|nr:hypothetical protein G6F38_002524 [Rhizopus arrhizus]KAG1158472.1 hypothetical protein G6F37_005767 [Rhizopus arrhizus]
MMIRPWALYKQECPERLERKAQYDVTQHSNTYAHIPLNDGSCRYLEVYSSKEHGGYDMVNNGLIFQMLNYQFFPYAALQGSAKIVTLKLNRLPFLPKTEDLTGLKKSHAVFDVTMDLGINAEYIKHSKKWIRA